MSAPPFKLEKTKGGWRALDDLDDVIAEGNSKADCIEMAEAEIIKRTIEERQHTQKMVIEVDKVQELKRWTKSADRWWLGTPAGKLQALYSRYVQRINRKVERWGRQKFLKKAKEAEEKLQRDREYRQDLKVSLYLGGDEYSSVDGKSVVIPCKNPPSGQRQQEVGLSHVENKRNSEKLRLAEAAKAAKGIATEARILSRNEQLIAEGAEWVKRSNRVKRIAADENVSPGYVNGIIPKI